MLEFSVGTTGSIYETESFRKVFIKCFPQIYCNIQVTDWLYSCPCSDPLVIPLLKQVVEVCIFCDHTLCSFSVQPVCIWLVAQYKIKTRLHASKVLTNILRTVYVPRKCCSGNSSIVQVCLFNTGQQFSQNTGSGTQVRQGCFV